MVTWGETLALGAVTVLVGLFVYSRAGALAAGAAVGSVSLVVAIVYAIRVHGHRGHRTRGGVVEGASMEDLSQENVNLIMSMLNLQDLSRLARSSKGMQGAADTIRREMILPGKSTVKADDFVGLGVDTLIQSTLLLPGEIAKTDRVSAMRADSNSSMIAFFDVNKNSVQVARIGSTDSTDHLRSYKLEKPELVRCIATSKFDKDNSAEWTVMFTVGPKLYKWKPFTGKNASKPKSFKRLFLVHRVHGENAIITDIKLSENGTHYAILMEDKQTEQGLFIVDGRVHGEVNFDPLYGAKMDFIEEGYAYTDSTDEYSRIAFVLPSSPGRSYEIYIDQTPVSISLSHSMKHLAALLQDGTLVIWNLAKVIANQGEFDNDDMSLDSTRVLTMSFPDLLKGVLPIAKYSFSEGGHIEFMKDENKLFMTLNTTKETKNGESKPKFFAQVLHIKEAKLARFIGEGNVSKASVSRNGERFVLLNNTNEMISLRPRMVAETTWDKATDAYREHMLSPGAPPT